MNEMKEIIRVRDISVGFNGRDVLGGLSFSVFPGDLLTVIGPNGSGKTTLLKAILGMVPLRTGSVELFGKKGVHEIEPERLIAYIPQRVDLDRTYPISLREMLALSIPGASSEKYVEMLELGGLMETRVGDLSGGELQRALLAYSLIKEPRLLMLDEPTSWVDVKGSDCILCAVEEFKDQGIAVVFVTHDVDVAKSISTKVLGLGRGGYFIEPAGSPELDNKITGLLGTRHHGLCERG